MQQKYLVCDTNKPSATLNIFIAKLVNADLVLYKCDNEIYIVILTATS